MIVISLKKRFIRRFYGFVGFALLVLYASANPSSIHANMKSLEEALHSNFLARRERERKAEYSKIDREIEEKASKAAESNRNFSVIIIVVPCLLFLASWLLDPKTTVVHDSLSPDSPFHSSSSHLPKPSSSSPPKSPSSSSHLPKPSSSSPPKKPLVIPTLGWDRYGIEEFFSHLQAPTRYNRGSFKNNQNICDLDVSNDVNLDIDAQIKQLNKSHEFTPDDVDFLAVVELINDIKDGKRSVIKSSDGFEIRLQKNSQIKKLSVNPPHNSSFRQDETQLISVKYKLIKKENPQQEVMLCASLTRTQHHTFLQIPNMHRLYVKRSTEGHFVIQDVKTLHKLLTMLTTKSSR